MPAVITVASIALCNHSPGGQVVLTAAQEVLQVGGVFVVAGSIAGSAIGAGCSLTSGSQTPCSEARTQDAGASPVLRVGGAAVALATAGGSANGAGGAAPTWSVLEVAQDVLSAS